MADNPKKDFDFFSEEVESSIDSLFTAKRTIEIDPLTNQIKEIEAEASVQPEISSALEKPAAKEEKAASKPETIAPSEDIRIFLEALKQAVLTFEWEITEKNIQSVKKYVDELESKTVLDNIVAKSIYTLIQDNLELMLSNPFKIPAKGPVAIQKGLDIIGLYVERGDDAILQAGDNVSSTLTLLEEIKNSFEKILRPISVEPAPLPEKQELISEDEIIQPVLEVKEDTKPDDEFDFEIAPLEEEIEQVSSEITEASPIPEEEASLKTTHSPKEINNEFASFEMDLEQSIASSFSDNIEVISPDEKVPEEETAQPEKIQTILSLEPVMEQPHEIIIEKPSEPEKNEVIVNIEKQELSVSEPAESLRLALEEDYKQPEQPIKEEIKTIPLSPVFIKEEVIKTEEKKPSEKPSVDYDSIFIAQIEHLDNYINKLKNLESVCCGIPSLNKLCLFAQGLKKEIENNKEVLSKYLSGDVSQIEKIAPEIYSKPQASPYDSFGKNAREISFEEPVVTRVEEAPKKIAPPPVIEQFNYTEIYVTVWGNDKVCVIPDEIAFDGNFPMWYRKKATRMNDIPLKLLKQWPWSKITPLLMGYITHLTESALSEMSLPLKKASNHPLGISQNPNVLILYKENQGCVLFTGNTLQIKSTRDYQWIPAEEDNFKGYLQKDEEKIKIFSIKKGS